MILRTNAWRVNVGKQAKLTLRTNFWRANIEKQAKMTRRTNVWRVKVGKQAKMSLTTNVWRAKVEKQAKIIHPGWHTWLKNVLFLIIICASRGKLLVAQLVEAQRYKPRSIPSGVIGNYHWHNPSSRTVALGSTQPLTEMSTRDVSWG
jgi:hypothetical protein